AYSELALTDESLGRATDAEQVSRKAVDLSETLPAQERYLIAANHARITKDYAKAIESYENLAKVSPDNTDILFALAKLYEDSGALDKAHTYYGKVLEADPKSVDVLLAVGRVAIESGDAQGGLDSLNRALSLSIQTGNDEEKSMVLQAIGIDYSILNKLEDALQDFQQSLEIKRRLGDKSGIANSLQQIAQIEASQGKADQALKNFNEALQIRREIGDKEGLGNALNDLGDFYNGRGQYDQALRLFKESLQIQRDVSNENNQGLALNNIGNTYLFKGDYDNARIYFEQALTIREKFKVPGDIADTLHNLAETATKAGQYDQAMAQYLRALDLRRGAGDKRGTAIESYSLGTVFGFQGRYSAAVNSKEEALKAFRELQEQGFWLAEILSGYGEALAQIGRSEEARKSLDEGLSLAHELKNDALVAQTLGYQGDDSFYRGDLKTAKALYEQAARVASRTADRHLILVSKVNLAKLAIKEGHAQAALDGLKGVAEEADTLGLQYLSVECSTDMAEALVNKKDYARATEQLESALGRSEKLGLRTLRAESHYLFARTLQLSGNQTEAARHYSQAHQILDEIRKEAGTDAVLKRSDLAPIYAASAIPPA
ncbi:MAG: tetratricopeptide repeat protein, partial [Candidatus Acidiferrales bacterium]